MKKSRVAVVSVLLAAVLLGAAPETIRAQQGGSMENLLRPYLDPDFTPTEGPDTDKAFMRQKAAEIKAALPEKLRVAPGQKPKILLLTTGTYGTLHTPGAAGLIILLREAVVKYGAFELTEVYTDAGLTLEKLKEYHAVVLNNVGRVPNPQFANEILPAYVRDGGGMLAVHSTALLSYKEPDAEFNRLLGGYVDQEAKYGHPQKQGQAFPVVLPQPDHPLVAAFKGEAASLTVTHRTLLGQIRKPYQVNIAPPKRLADELYVLLPAKGQDTPPQVLVQIDRATAPQVYPDYVDDFAYALTWIKTYGKGRVFYTQFGHNMAVYAVPCVAGGILDGLLYAAGAQAPARREEKTAAAAGNPIFPYFFQKFEGQEAKLKEIGYTPTPFLLTKIDFTKNPPYESGKIQHWIQVMAKSGPGFVFVHAAVVRDSGDEEEAIRIVRETADVAQPAGFFVSVYPYFGSHVPSAEKALPFVQRIKRDNVGLTLHLPQEIKGGNARRFPEIIEKVKDHINLVVVCGADLPAEGDDPAKWPWSRLIRPLGEGDFDVGGFVRLVKATGYDGYFSQICWGIERPALDYLPQSIERWKGFCRQH